MQDVKVSLRDYIRIFFYWRSLIIVSFLVILATAVIGSFLWPPTYEGATTLLVEQPREVILTRPSSGTPSVPPPVSLTEAREELAKTQSEIIKSRFLLGKVVDELGLAKEIKESLPRERAINRLQKRISVSLVMDTNVIRLVAEAKTSTAAADIANCLAKFYVEWASEVRRNKAKGAYSFLGTQAETVEKELRGLEDALQELKETKGVQALDEQTRSAVEQLGVFDTEYNKTISAEEETRARVNEVRDELTRQKEMVITSTDVTTNTIVNALKLKLVDMEIKLTDLKSKYTDDNPMVVSTLEEIEQVKNKLNAEVAKVFGKEITSTNPIYQDLVAKLIGFETDLNALEAKRKALGQIRDTYAKRLTNLSEAEVEYTRLLRRIKGKEALYLTLLEKQGEAGLTEALENSLIVNVKIIDEAAPPVKPARPKKLLNGILGAVVGLIVGIGAAFVREYWDHTLKTVSQVHRYVNVPVVGVIPVIREKKAVPYRVGSNIGEAYTSLRTALIRICKEKSVKTVLVTSANNQEGKSTTVANLAVSLSGMRDYKTLAVDANLRRPDLYRLFQMSSYTNLSDVLRRQGPEMFRGLGADALSVITAGESPDDPTKLFTSPEMKSFLKEAKAKFDLVVLDSSSVVPYTDSAILAQEVDGIILVVKAGVTRREVVERACQVLHVPPEKVLGIVLNAVEYVIPERLYKKF